MGGCGHARGAALSPEQGGGPGGFVGLDVVRISLPGFAVASFPQAGTGGVAGPAVWSGAGLGRCLVVVDFEVPAGHQQCGDSVADRRAELFGGP